MVLLHQIFGGQAEGVLKLIRDTIKKQIVKSPEIFPAKAIADRLSKTSKSISVDAEFVDNLLYTHKNDRYAFAILALLFPHLDYKNRDFHLDHCHPESSFSERRLKALGIVLDDSNKEYFTDGNYYDTIINLQMLDGNENKSKNDKNLKEWVNDYQPSLKKHYLPKELELSEFPIFVDKRYELLQKELTDVLTFT